MPDGRGETKTPSQTEGGKVDVEPAKGRDQSNNKDEASPFKAMDLRLKSPEGKALRVAELHRSLARLEGKTSGRAMAMRASIVYKINILRK